MTSVQTTDRDGHSAASATEPLGSHLLPELYDCDRELLHDNERLAVRFGAGWREVESVFHPFSPGGLSGAIVIAKSHDTLHLWPEISCGDIGLPKRVEGAIIDFIAARRYKATYVDRGLPETSRV
jgi:S-adenosylmethionine decarboxylase